jgi:Zn-dependent protease
VQWNGADPTGDRTVPDAVFHAVVFWLPAFLFSTTVHEAAHAAAALRLGDPTAYLAGRVTLSPWPHVRRSPLGMLVIPVITSLTQGWTLGWASAPYDPAWADQHPRRAALMALAGPLGNLAIALAAFALLQAGLWLGVFEPAAKLGMQHLVQSAGPLDVLRAVDFFAEALSVLLSLNALLFVFNLLPLPPLDGAAVVTLAFPAQAARAIRAAVMTPAMAFVGIFAAWQVFPSLVQPLIGLLVRLLHVTA